MNVSKGEDRENKAVFHALEKYGLLSKIEIR
jgi:hypothetical protein